MKYKPVDRTSKLLLKDVSTTRVLEMLGRRKVVALRFFSVFVLYLFDSIWQSDIIMF